MKSIRATFRRSLAFAFIATATASAQSVDTPAPKTAATGSDEESVVMSPFVVNTAKDVGFVASTSLAGGRLAGELKDTPVAYSVLTREFIDALDITDLMAASEWVVNSVNITGSGEQEIFGNGFETTSRGVSASPQQRNFFPLNVNLDSYNLDRYDYSRGPNAILFGNGTFGGTSNSTTKVPLFNRRFTQLKLSYGSWDYRRAALDDNRPLTDTLSIRTNAVMHARQGWRDHEMERKKAITIAATWKAAKNTEFTIDAEVGRIERNNPPTFLYDILSGWDGATTFSTVQTNAIVPSNTVLQAAGVSRYGSDTAPSFIFSPVLPMTQVENYAGTMRTIGGGVNATTRVGGVLLPSGAAAPNLQTRPMLEALNAAPWRFDVATANSKFRVPDRDYAMSTYSPTLRQNYRTYTALGRHRIGQNLHLEGAFNVARESRRTNYLNARQLNEVMIDINRNLPNGQLNPMFLEPYGQGQRTRSQWANDYASGRLAAAYTLNNTRVGSYLFNVMAGGTNQTQFQRIESMRVLRDADPRNWPFGDENRVFYRYYWNGSSFFMPEIREAVYNGVTYPVAWIVDSQRPTDISTTETSFRYAQSAIKGRWFDNKLHSVLAVRRDTLDLTRTINDNYGDYPTNWDGRTVQYRPAAPADYLTLPESRPRNALRQPTVTDGRYQDDYGPPDVNLKATTYSTGLVYHFTPWLSGFANWATSFNPSTSQLRLDGSLMPSPESSGWDAGIRLFLLNNRVNVTAIYYEGEETAQPFEISFTNNIQNIAFLNRLDDFDSVLNQRGLPLVPRQAFDMRDRENHGYELEVTANLTRNWRLTLNGAVSYAYQTNAFADTRAFLAQYKETMRQVLLDGGVIFDASDRAVTDASVPNSRRMGGNTTEANSARDGWNNIFFNQVPNIVAGKQEIANLTSPTANIFTDYQFTEGFLKNFRIGGGINYRGEKVIGYRGGDTIQDPAQPNNFGSSGAIDDPSVDAYSVVTSPSYYTVTATFSYSMRLKDRRRLNLHLRIANLLDDDQAIYSGATVQRPPGGDFTKTAARVATPTNYRWETPRSYTLSATLEF